MDIDWLGREQEDAEMENMRRDQQEFPLSVHAAIVAALDWINRFGGHAPIVFGGEAELAAQLDEARRQLEASFPLSIVPPVIPYEGEDEPVHTAENGYQCSDPTCPCNQPKGRIARLIEASVRAEIAASYQGVHVAGCPCDWCRSKA